MIHREVGGSPSIRPGRLNNRELVEELCAESADLREQRRTHVHSFGTLIPHVFMGNVLAHVGRCLVRGVRRDPAQPVSEVISILRTLEHGMEKGDRETRNVISISFARDAEMESFFELLRPYLGQRMKVQLAGS